MTMPDRALLEFLIDNSLNFLPILTLAFAMTGATLGLIGDVLIAAPRYRFALAFVCLASAVGLGVASVALALQVPRIDNATNETAPSIRIASFNVLFSNDQHDLLIDWLRREQPDFVLLQEVEEKWWKSLEAVKDLYPYHTKGHARIYSRYPLKDVDLRAKGYPEHWQHAKAWVETPAGNFWIIAAHFPKPTIPERFNARHARMEQVAGLIPKEGPVIQAGDFNSTPYSPTFVRYLARTRLSLTAPFPGPASWPVWLPDFIGLRIDHILSRCFERRNYSIGPSLGSNHRMVIAELSPNRNCEYNP